MIIEEVVSKLIRAVASLSSDHKMWKTWAVDDNPDDWCCGLWISIDGEVTSIETRSSTEIDAIERMLIYLEGDDPNVVDI